MGVSITPTIFPWLWMVTIIPVNGSHKFHVPYLFFYWESSTRVTLRFFAFPSSVLFEATGQA